MSATDSSATTDSETCKLCVMAPDTDPVQTTNRGLFQVNNRVHIVPMCEDHETFDTAELVQKAVDNGGAQFLKDCIEQGVLTEAEANEHAPDNIDF